MWGWFRRTSVAPPSPDPAEAPPTQTPDDWLAKLPSSVVAIDVETTGLHSEDRIVSLGAIWLPTAPLAEGAFNVSYIHLIFDPGRKSHPKAEEVHGYDDWLLRHQTPFAAYADQIRRFLYSGEIVLAHNASFDMGFVNREMELAGKSARLKRPIYCTMQGYRDGGHSGSASLSSVCGAIGLVRAGRRHGALEDAWMALMAYLWLHGCPHRKPFIDCSQHLDVFNLCPCPPRPEGPLPRRKRHRE